MSTDQNKAVVRRFFEAWDRGDASVLEEVLARDVCDHNPSPGQPRGLEGQRWFLESVRRAMPDTTVAVLQIVAEGDLVADHWTTSATQTGEFLGIPPTGTRFTMTGSDLMRVSNGKIVEFWHLEDTLSMLQQLGVLPASQPQGTQDTGRRASAGGMSEPSRGKTLSDAEKREVLRRGAQEFVDKGNASAVDTLLAPDYVGHFSGSPAINGREAFKQFIELLSNGLSSRHATIEDMLIEREYGACRVTLAGKHTGNLFGFAPSGKQVMVQSVRIFRFAGDQIAEEWANNDDMGLMQQIGVAPVPQGVPMPEPC